MQERLRLPDSHYASLVQNAFDAIISKDVRGVIQSWNRAAENILGWRQDEMVGRPIQTIIPEDRRAEEDLILARIRSGQGVPKLETLRLHKTGKAVPVTITISPIVDAEGQIVGASKIVYDVSDVIELRKRLAESELQFRMLANSIPQLAWIADEHGSIFWYNDRWYDYTGSNLETMHGWGWTAVHHPDHVERVKARIKKSWDSGDDWEDVFPLRSKDGEYRWFLSRARPLRDQAGRIIRWFGTNTDVTEQRQREQHIELLMRELEHRSKNMFSVVHAIISRTTDVTIAESLGRRLQALARNQDILTRRSWAGAPIGELILSQLSAAQDLLGQRISIEGDLEILLVPSAAEPIGLAVFELCTNAVKYGSLSNALGTVLISIARTEHGEDRMLSIVWEERGGPAPALPQRKGFGSVMIDRNLRAALSAHIEIDYPATGFTWRFKAPLDLLVAKRADL